MIFRAVFGGRERPDVPAPYSRGQVCEVDPQRPSEPDHREDSEVPTAVLEIDHVAATHGGERAESLLRDVHSPPGAANVLPKALPGRVRVALGLELELPDALVPGDACGDSRAANVEARRQLHDERKPRNAGPSVLDPVQIGPIDLGRFPELSEGESGGLPVKGHVGSHPGGDFVT